MSSRLTVCEDKQTSNRIINLIQILTGIAALLFGAGVYFLGRPADLTSFISNFNLDIQLSHNLPNVLGPLAGNIPAFAHVFAFILITSGLIASRKPGYLIVCSSWFLVEILFELGQKFHPSFSSRIPDWFAGIPFLENTRSYFQNGTFDPLDLAAITLGSLLGFWVLSATMDRRAS